MLELFVELLDGGHSRVERVMLCPGSEPGLATLVIESQIGKQKCTPSTHRNADSCTWTWNALLAVEYAHYRNPKIAEEPVRWFCVDPKVG